MVSAQLGDHLAPLRTHATLRGSPSAPASECNARGITQHPCERMQRSGDHPAPLRTNATLRGSPSASASECYSWGLLSAPTNELLCSGEPLAPPSSKTNGLAKTASSQREQMAHPDRNNCVAAMLQQHGIALPQRCTAPTTTPLPTTPTPCTTMGPS